MEISHITRMKDLVFGGTSCNEIAEIFNKEGIPTSRKYKKYPNGRWTSTTIKRILQNPIYAGIVVTGRLKKIDNPLAESFFKKKMSPEMWDYKIIPNCPYKFMEPNEWIRLQVRLKGIEDKVKGHGKGRGRPEGEFGPSIVSGLQYCWYDDAPLVNGRGKYPRCFRCKNRRKKIGSPERCEQTYTVREDLVVPVYRSISVEIIRKLYDECLRVVNEEFYYAGNLLREEISKKEFERLILLDKKESLIDMVTIARKKGYGNLEEYVKEACAIDKKLKTTDKDLENLRDANAIALDPLCVDKKMFDEALKNLDSLFNGTDNVTQLRTALKTFLPHVRVLVEEIDSEHARVRMRIDQIPASLSEYIRPEHEYIQSRRRSIQKCLDVGYLSSNIRGIKNLESLYDFLSDSYEFDNKSYEFQAVVPLFWEVLIEKSEKRKKDPYSVKIEAYSYPHRPHEEGAVCAESSQSTKLILKDMDSFELEFEPLEMRLYWGTTQDSESILTKILADLVPEADLTEPKVELVTRSLFDGNWYDSEGKVVEADKFTYSKAS